MSMSQRCRRGIAHPLFLTLLLSASAAQASNVGVNLDIHLGNQPQPVIVQQPAYEPPPAYTPPPVVYAPPTVVVENDVNFIYPAELGFYVAVGVPYDLFYVGNAYYLYRDGRWLCAPGPRGPWVVQRYRELPPGLRRYRIDRIREYRTREYGVYRRDHDHYRGRHFRMAKEEWKEQRKADKRAEKEYRKEEKERWKEDRREEKERWKEEKHGRGHHDRD